MWGLCQGSGKDLYQARVDLSEPGWVNECIAGARARAGSICLWRLLPAGRGDEAAVLVECDREAVMTVGAVGAVGRCGWWGVRKNAHCSCAVAGGKANASLVAYM